MSLHLQSIDIKLSGGCHKNNGNCDFIAARSVPYGYPRLPELPAVAPVCDLKRTFAAVVTHPSRISPENEVMPNMNLIAQTPPPPYYAVIFTSHRTAGDQGYGVMAAKMVELAAQQSGFLGVESAREDVGITVSYWSDLDSIKAWKANLEHQDAQRIGHEKWYSSFKVRISKVERDYGF